MLSFLVTGNYTDLYQLSMSEVNFLEGRKDDRACFDYFFRKIPFDGGYVVYAGLADVLNVLEDLHFTQTDLKFLKSLNFERTFIDYLERFQFRGSVYSAAEGDLVFPNTPILRIEGNIIEAQIVETFLLNILNFESLVATKASRMRQVAGDAVLSDFGLRRSQGPGGVLATRASIIGGFNSTSNVYAAGLYGLDVSGTMAHAFIESYESELEAFRAFARSRPEGCVFLVDTYDTIHSGIPNTITVAKEMEMAGNRAAGIRLDSGDLAWLSTAARKMMDDAGLEYMKIVVSNQLDEHVIRSLRDQRSPIDVYGVGTRLVTGYPDGALDGVYKLAMINDQPKLKMSETSQKTTLPGQKEVLRMVDEDGFFAGADLILLKGEDEPSSMYHPYNPARSFDVQRYIKEPLLSKVMDKGRIVADIPTLGEVAGFAKSRLAKLPPEFKRFDNPHVYKVGVSNNLLELRDQLIKEYKTHPDESTV